MRMPRVCFVITEDWYFWSHRRQLAQYLVGRGCRVDVVTNIGRWGDHMKAAGFISHAAGLQRRGRDPVGELQAIRRLAQLFRDVRPDVVHLVGMKPILYGSIAASLANVPATVCAVAGLGWLFTDGGLVKTAARQVLRAYFREALANRTNVRFIVQNSSHRDLLTSSKMANEDQISLIPGAGVDTNRFSYSPEPNDTPTVLTHARMLWDKGIGDLVAAARLIHQRQIECKFMLVGDPDPANPASIPRGQLEQWNLQGNVTWQPRRDDVPQLLSKSHIACLPSYHEGFPLSLVEASSCGRPVVTNDIPGCRDVVEHNETGLLVRKQDVEALANALIQLIQRPERRRQLGCQGRQRVVQQMSCQIVNEQTFACYEHLLQGMSLSRASETITKRAA